MMCIDISINNDEICEEDEDFQLLLESGSEGGTTITNSPGSVVIIDDDGMCLLTTYLQRCESACSFKQACTYMQGFIQDFSKRSWGKTI